MMMREYNDGEYDKERVLLFIKMKNPLKSTFTLDFFLWDREWEEWVNRLETE